MKLVYDHRSVQENDFQTRRSQRTWTQTIQIPKSKISSDNWSYFSDLNPRDTSVLCKNGACFVQIGLMKRFKSIKSLPICWKLVIKSISCTFLISISQPNWNKSSTWLVSILSARHDAHYYHFFKCWAGNRHCWLLSDTTSAFLRTFHKITGRRLAARRESSKGRCLARPQFCVLFASQRDSKECLPSITQITITFIFLKITRNKRHIRAQSGDSCASWNSWKWYLTI